MTELSLSRLHYPVHNLGFGRRAGIWFQGCTIRCPGCISRDTWSFRAPGACDTDDVLAWLDGLPADEVDGVTISGGEPTDQPAALRALLDGIARRRAARAAPVDVLLYSGRESQSLLGQYEWLSATVDLLVAEPFLADRAGAHALRGSGNQVVHRFTDLARKRYPATTFEADYASQRRSVGVRVEGQSVWMVGIPLPGDLNLLRAGLSARGVEVIRTSWPT
ncbi:radical SAM protein [Nocardia sp. BMG111209]|uniref:radical SAM protein n=1 Tax=Nocardia sp. BMG111209 TaxID=1160137 RepID=UPI00035E8541|nr:radical SAM protein [Nocardia sp. BMG111209]